MRQFISVRSRNPSMSTSLTGLGRIHFEDEQDANYEYLECNGQAISRTDYPDLFKLIGTTFGHGDNLTTFNLPDL